MPRAHQELVRAEMLNSTSTNDTTHDTRHTTHDTRHTTHDTRQHVGETGRGDAGGSKGKGAVPDPITAQVTRQVSAGFL
jgi:hypothetical protein